MFGLGEGECREGKLGEVDIEFHVCHTKEVGISPESNMKHVLGLLSPLSG